MSIEAIREAASKHEACGNKVYLTSEQCGKFGTSYAADAARCAIAASALLQSADYDQAHKDVFSPLGGQTLVLVRQPEQAPGWFTITMVFPA